MNQLTGPWSLTPTLLIMLQLWSLHCVTSKSLKELDEFSGHLNDDGEDDTRPTEESYEYSPYYSQDWVYIPSKFVPPVYQASYYIPSTYTPEYFQSSEYTPSVFIKPPMRPTPPPKPTPATTAYPKITTDESKPEPSKKKDKKHSSLHKHKHHKSTGNILQNHPLTDSVSKTLIPGSKKTSSTSGGKKGKKVVQATRQRSTSTTPIYGTVLNSFGLGK